MRQVREVAGEARTVLRRADVALTVVSVGAALAAVGVVAVLLYLAGCRHCRGVQL